MDKDLIPPELPTTERLDTERVSAWPDPDMVRLIELVEQIGGEGQQPL